MKVAVVKNKANGEEVTKTFKEIDFWKVDEHGILHLFRRHHAFGTDDVCCSFAAGVWREVSEA